MCNTSLQIMVTKFPIKKYGYCDTIGPPDIKFRTLVTTESYISPVFIVMTGSQSTEVLKNLTLLFSKQNPMV